MMASREIDRIAGACAAVLGRTEMRRPSLGLILGSGLGPFADALENSVSIPYSEIPHFPELGVSGHSGELVIGDMAGKTLVCLKGRAHAYEGRIDAMAVPVRVMKVLGVEALYITASAGSLNLDVGPGRLMTITDHLNLMGTSPLVGPNVEGFGPRFPPMADAYDPELIARQQEAAKTAGVELASGVYAAWLGPAFETPAEVRMIKGFGADAVGMSVVPECLLARHCGLKVTATAVITNFGVGMTDMKINHDQTLAGAKSAEEDFRRFLEAFVASS